MDNLTVILALFVTAATAHEGTLLCRACGLPIAEGAMLSDVKSPLALKYFNMSVLGKSRLVQVLRNPTPRSFNVITSTAAYVSLTGGAYSAETWFPGYEWTACICPRCQAHMGWYFQSGNIQSKSAKSFVGLVLDNLISADYADSLIRTL